MTQPGPKQLAIRLDDETFKLIDKKRMEIGAKEGSIPSRSDIVRMALDNYLASIKVALKRK